jgi:hypothetical protein
MHASDSYTNGRYRLSKLPAALLALTLSTGTLASDGGFIGVYTGISSSLDADDTSTTYKILTGAHVTSRISLEFGYVNFGSTRYDAPTAINVNDNSSNISFRDAEHGSISHGQLGEATVIAGGRDTYNAKGSSSFTGMSKFKPQGMLINFRYRFPIADSFDFFLKTGFFAWWSDYTTIKHTASQDGSLVTVKEKSSQTSAVNPISGGGFIYHPIPQLSLRAELETTAISSAEMPRTRLQNINLGVNWEF